ncbi:MAG: tRNA 2-thiouridine(34) synthase MnmA [Victivallales bacterium]|nr:tRNA 2-thiouridine(34) synthase MnmA [Victivallales bacterium]
MKIGIGISGGVDSAVTAALLQGQGHDVVGYTMVLVPEHEATAKKAAAVAAKLKIPHKVVDLREAFESEILQYFTETYAAGRTPSPCARCNRCIKLGMLAAVMQAEGCERMATGHYARILNSDGQYQLWRGLDSTKDQSYFLSQLTQEQLAYTLFPLGEMEKTQVKAMGEMFDLVPKSQSESQDLCFLPNGGFADFVAARKPELRQEGWILDEDGKRLGKHNGAFQYTIGQRRGLGLGGGPWFVTAIDTQANSVTIAHEERRTECVHLTGVNWLVPEPEPGTTLRAQFQLRYLMKPRDGVLLALGGGQAGILFREPVPAVPCGQLAVAYDGDRVIASGWIERD